MNKKNSKLTLTRRDFLKSSAVGALGAMVAPSLLTTGCSSSSDDAKLYPDALIPEMLPQAPDGRPLKAGLIGCGGSSRQFPRCREWTYRYHVGRHLPG